MQWLRKRLDAEGAPDGGRPRLVYNESHVLARLTFEELVRVVLPLSDWFYRTFLKPRLSLDILRQLAADKSIHKLLMDPAWQDEDAAYPEDIINMARIAGAVSLGRARDEENESWQEYLSTAVRELGFATP